MTNGGRAMYSVITALAVLVSCSSRHSPHSRLALLVIHFVLVQVAFGVAGAGAMGGDAVGAALARCGPFICVWVWFACAGVMWAVSCGRCCLAAFCDVLFFRTKICS